jgi:hypothetical protein
MKRFYPVGDRVRAPTLSRRMKDMSDVRERPKRDEDFSGREILDATSISGGTEF